MTHPPQGQGKPSADPAFPPPGVNAFPSRKTLGSNRHVSSHRSPPGTRCARDRSTHPGAGPPRALRCPGHVIPMKTFLLSLALLPLLVVMPTAVAQSDAVLLCDGPVCDLICDTYNWVGSHPWFDWIANNPFIHISRYCPIA